MSEHRVSMLGASWRRVEDPTRSRDARVRAVVAALAALPQPQVRPEFRAELRAQLVAITPRIVADAATEDTMVDIVPRPEPKPAAARPRPAPARHADTGVLDRVPRVRLGRPLAVAAAVLTAFAVLLGGATWLSKSALPGDALYGLKRASEQLELATAGGGVDKAKDYLGFAVTRANEARSLAGGAGDADTAKLITSTLASADSDVKSASVLLGKQAVQRKSAAPLTTMTSWAPAQIARLQQVAAALPPGPLRQHALASAALVTAAADRARALRPELGCSCLATSGTDELGPVPCNTCTQQPVAPAPSPQPARHGSAPKHVVPVARSTGAPAASPSRAAGPRGTAPTAPASSSGSAGGGALPSLNLPLPTSTAPVSASSCGLGATLGPLGVVIGLCPISVQIH